MGKFQVVIKGALKYNLEIIPEKTWVNPPAALKGKILYLSVTDEDLMFIPNEFYTDWIDLSEYITKNRASLFTAGVLDDDTDWDVIKDAVTSEEGKLSLRWDFTVPQAVNAGGDLFVRAVHEKAATADNKGLTTHNVLAVNVLKVPVLTVACSPDLNLGFTPPFIPLVCAQSPISMDEFRRVVDEFLFTVLPKLGRFDSNEDLEYIRRNNRDGMGVTVMKRYPNHPKPQDKIGVFTPAGGIFKFFFKPLVFAKV